METFKIDISPVHDVKGTGLDRQRIEDVDVMGFAVSDADEAGNTASERQEGMDFYSGFVFTKSRPGKKREAKIDGCGIEGVGGLNKVDTEALICIEDSGACNQHMGKIGPYSPVTIFVCVSEGAFTDSASETGMVEFCFNGAETRFDITEIFTSGNLGKRHGEELIETGQLPDSAIPLIPVDAEIEFIPGDEIEELGKDDTTLVHRRLLDEKGASGLMNQHPKFKSKNNRRALNSL